MYDGSKLTYVIVSVLVLVLGTAGYLLRSDAGKSEVSAAGYQINTNSQGELNQNTTSTNVTSGPKAGEGASTIISNLNKGVIASTGTDMNIPQNITGVIINTNLGEIEFSFSENAPNTVANFVSLVSAKFYDGVRFHRVIKDFMIQTGDPLSKDASKSAYWGTGGPGYKFNDELTGQEKYLQGVVAMANSGPNTNGSQFFIVTASPMVDLPPNYTVFGKVTKGLDVALKIQAVKTSPNDRPVSDVIIESVTLK